MREVLRIRSCFDAKYWVVHGEPVHIDVGQFVYNENIRDPKIHNQEYLLKHINLTFGLKEEYPELSTYLKDN